MGLHEDKLIAYLGKEDEIYFHSRGCLQNTNLEKYFRAYGIEFYKSVEDILGQDRDPTVCKKRRDSNLQSAMGTHREDSKR